MSHPGWIKKKSLVLIIKDSQHYLKNSLFSPGSHKNARFYHIDFVF